MTDEKPCPIQITSEKITEVDNKTSIKGDKDTRRDVSQPFSRLGEKIYEIAQQIMDKHYRIKISDLTTACTRFIKDATKRDIINEIDRLEREKFFLDGNALMRDTLLENPTRKNLLEFITKSPGINFSGMRNATGKGNFSLAWHLSVLEKFSLIRAATIDGSLVYFPKESPPDRDVLNAFLNKTGMKEVLLMLIRHKQVKCKDIEFALKLPHATAFRRLRRLIERGFVKEVVDVEHNTTWYELNPAWIEILNRLQEM